MYITERLSALRKLMRENGMDAYVIVTDDFHGSEYVGDYFKEREFMSGFTGSAGKIAVPSVAELIAHLPHSVTAFTAKDLFSKRIATAARYLLPSSAGKPNFLCLIKGFF